MKWLCLIDIDGSVYAAAPADILAVPLKVPGALLFVAFGPTLEEARFWARLTWAKWITGPSEGAQMMRSTGQGELALKVAEVEAMRGVGPDTSTPAGSPPSG